MSILYQFGAYAYPKSIITELPTEFVTKTRFGETPGRPGQYTQGGLLGARQLQLAGHLVPAVGDDLATLFDALKVAHAPGLPQSLYLGRDDRYILAEVVGFKDVDPSKYPTSIKWAATFAASDPFTYAGTASSTNLSTGSGGSTNVVVGGTAPGVPTLTLTVTAGTIATVGTITVTNTTTGKVLKLTTPITGGTVVSSAATHTLTTAAGTADLTYLFSGQFWELAPNQTNVITIATTGGVLLQTATISWRNRWY